MRISRENIGGWLVIMTTLIGGLWWLFAVDAKAQRADERSIENKDKIEVLEKEHEMIIKIDERTENMQEDIKIIKEKLIK